MAARRVAFIGDVHGCMAELQALLKRLGWQSTRAKAAVGAAAASTIGGAGAEAGPSVVMVGDLVGKGPRSAEVVRFCREEGLPCVMGNHEFKLLRCIDDPGHAGAPDCQHCGIGRELSSADVEWLRELPLHLSFPDHNALVVHAGLVPGTRPEDNKPNDLMNMRNLTDEGLPVSAADEGTAWAAAWRGPETVIFGHDAIRGLQLHPFAIGLDTGCCYGGALSAVVLPGREIVAVPAAEMYSTPNRAIAVGLAPATRTATGDAAEESKATADAPSAVAYVCTNAFTHMGKGGNAAGIVLPRDAAGLSAAAKQAVAAKLGFSETVFVHEVGLGDDTEADGAAPSLRLEYFTPDGEVDLCGHATVASIGHLSRARPDLVPSSGAPVLVNTKAGLVTVTCDGTAGIVMMTQTLPTFDDDAVGHAAGAAGTPSAATTAPALAAALGVLEDDVLLWPHAPVVGSTGLRDLMVHVRAEALRTMTPDMAALAKLSEELDTVGVHAFTLDLCAVDAIAADASVEGPSKPVAFVRNFAPRVGIDEESATGTSNCVLGSLLARCLMMLDGKAVPPWAKRVDRREAETDAGSTVAGVDPTRFSMVFAQGDMMGSPSRVHVDVVAARRSGGDGPMIVFPRAPMVGGQFGSSR